MKCCIPILRNAFLESEVSNHFGRAPEFLILEVAEGRILSLIRNERNWSAGGGPVAVMIAQGVDWVACRSLGSGAMARLESAGIKVFHAPQRTVEEVLMALQSGELKELQRAQTCQGHHGHEEGKSHCCEA